MMTLVSYDVSTADAAGRTRLRKVAKTLEDYAQRVQNSVFEVNVDYATFLTVKDKLINLIDQKKDSLRFYYLGNDWKKKVEELDGTYTFISDQTFPSIDVIKSNMNLKVILKKHENDEGINPHQVNPNYLKKTEAEENLTK